MLKCRSKPDPLSDISPIFKTEQDIIDYGKQAVENVIKYGSQDWYHWCIENWNTKWNACNTNYYEEDPYTVYFQTAWADVRGLIQELSAKYPEHNFEYEYAEEQMGYYCGKSTFIKGVEVGCCVYEDYSKEAYEQSFSLWGEDENYVFDEKTGTYKYVDEDDEQGEM